MEVGFWVLFCLGWTVAVTVIILRLRQDRRQYLRRKAWGGKSEVEIQRALCRLAVSASREGQGPK
jgi:hypothetical protein